MRNGQAYQQKAEKISVSEEKKFGKIDSTLKIQDIKGSRTFHQRKQL